MTAIRLQGRDLSESDLAQIRQLREDHPGWPRFATNLRWGHRFLQASLVLPLYQKDQESSSRTIPGRFEMATVVKKPGKNAPETKWEEYHSQNKEKNLSKQFVTMAKEMRDYLNQVWNKNSVCKVPVLLVAMYSWMLLAGLACYGPGRTQD